MQTIFYMGNLSCLLVNLFTRLLINLFTKYLFHAYFSSISAAIGDDVGDVSALRQMLHGEFAPCGLTHQSTVG